MTTKNVANSIYRNSYHETLILIEKGFYDEASEMIRSLRKKMELPHASSHDSILHILSILLSSRIAMKGGLTPSPLLHLQTTTITDPFVRGEVYFVRGLYYSSKFQFKECIECFNKASMYLKQSGNKEREWLARLNAVIGQSHDPEILSHFILSEFRKIEMEIIQENPSHKLIGIIHRQKSVLYKELGHYLAAKNEAIKAIPIIELRGSQSDYHLALLNLVDICLELNEIETAKETLEFIVPPVDPRVKFPLNYFQSRLGLKELDLADQVFSCPHFLERYKLWISKNVNTATQEKKDISTEVSSSTENNIKWNPSKGELLFHSQVFLFKPNSLEKLIIDHLMIAPLSKSLLCERIWPDSSELKLLDNRLHRLISRINKKVSSLIQYEKGRYSIRDHS